MVNFNVNIRKNLFKILVAVASLGIAETAFAQDGAGIRYGMLDGTMRITTVQVPFYVNGTVATSTIPSANFSATGIRAGANGWLAVVPRDAQSVGSLASGGTTITTSIAAMPYPARVVVKLTRGTAASAVFCQRLTISGFDQYGRGVGQGSSGLPVYTLNGLDETPHTTSVAFSKITRIRLDYCSSGASTSPGGGGNLSGGVQLRVAMSRHIGLPFKASQLSDIKLICREGLGTASGTGGEFCVDPTTFTQAQSGCVPSVGSLAFSYDKSRNTLVLPICVAGSVPQVNPPTAASELAPLVMNYRDRYRIVFKGPISPN